MIISIPGIVSQGGGEIKVLPLNDYSWAEISEISQAGLADKYFSVGDRKAVTLNGTVGNVTFSNKTYYCYILGINHNSSVEGQKRIHFQFGYSALSGGVNLAFVDSGYNSKKDSGSWFNFNNQTDDPFGWRTSSLRTVICPAFKNAMPSDLRAVLKTVTKYSQHNAWEVDAVSATSEQVFLPSEFEVYGVQKNTYSTKQEQYAYYVDGNSKNKNNHSSTNSGVIWYLRSIFTGSGICALGIDANGNEIPVEGTTSCGFAPCFCV